jgi:photosystem II stability/assembly factor-like uncharacterized protein
MTSTSRRSLAVMFSLSLLCSLALAGWTQLTVGVPAELYAIHFPAGTQVGYAVGAGIDSLGGEAGAIVKTTDGGTTWTSQVSGVTSPLKSVYFTSDDNGYAVGNAGTGIRTTDGGATWTPMTIPGTDMLNYVRFPGNGQTGYIGVYPRNQAGKVIKTTDGGSNWADVSVGGAMSWSISCGMATDQIGVALGKGGMVYGTTDGFGTASAQGPQTTADLIAAAFSPADPNTGYLIGNDSVQGVIRFTSTGGASLWDSVRCPVITSFFGVDVPTATAAYVCGTGGYILRSVSNTDFYQTTTGVTVDIYGVCFPGAQEDTGFACGSGSTILRTYDKGIPWIPGVAEGRVPAVKRSGIRVVSNPSRHGIALHSDADVRVSVYDAAGRTVVSQAATRGLNFLPLPTGAYFVKAGSGTARAVVTD